MLQRVLRNEKRTEKSIPTERGEGDYGQTDLIRAYDNFLYFITCFHHVVKVVY